MASHPDQSPTPDSPTRLPQPAFQALLAEAQALAGQLRKNLDALHRQDGLPSGALGVLETLSDHGPLTVPQIARLRHTSRQNVQIEVNRLRAAGRVESKSNPAHKRSGLVYLKPAGEALVTAARQRQDRAFQSLSSTISETEAIAATRVLQRLGQNLASAGAPERVPGPKPQHPRRKPQPSPPPPQPPPAQTEEPPEDTELPISLL